MKQQFSEMGQQDMQDDKYLDTFETQSMAALVISLEYTQDLIQRGEIQAESLFYVSAASTGPWAEHNESDLAHVVSTHLLGSSAYCYHNGSEKGCQRLGQKPGERMRTEPGLKLKGGWKGVKFSEAGDGGRDLATHGGKFSEYFT